MGLLVIIDALKLHSRMSNYRDGSVEKYGGAWKDTADAAEISSLSGMIESKGVSQMVKGAGVSGQEPRQSVRIMNCQGPQWLRHCTLNR